MLKNYKSIFFFVKIVIAICAIYFIYYKVFKTEHWPLAFEHIIIAARENCILIIGAILLMPLNWTIEALKWKLICSSTERMSVRKSLCGVFAGVTISVFTPNRVGEFLGKTLTLKPENRLSGISFSVVTGISQMIITTLFALCSFLFSTSAMFSDELITVSTIIISFALLVFVLFFLLGRLSANRYSGNIRQLLNAIKSSGYKLYLLLFLSALRYAVFSLQFALLLNALNTGLDFNQLLVIIPITFFISTLVPSFMLTEVVSRTAIAGFVCSAVAPGQNQELASASYFLLWMINIAAAAFVGIFSIHFIDIYPGRND